MAAMTSTNASQQDQLMVLNDYKQRVPYLRDYSAEYEYEKDPFSPENDQKWRARCYFKTPGSHFSTIIERCDWKDNKDDARREAARLMVAQINATTFSPTA